MRPEKLWTKPDNVVTAPQVATRMGSHRLALIFFKIQFDAMIATSLCVYYSHAAGTHGARRGCRSCRILPSRQPGFGGPRVQFYIPARAALN